MKIRIEFESDGSAKESQYDAVEFSTEPAECIDSWGNVIRTLVGLSCWNSKLVFLSAIVECESQLSPHSSWVKENIASIKQLSNDLSNLVGKVESL